MKCKKAFIIKQISTEKKKEKKKIKKFKKSERKHPACKTDLLIRILKPKKPVV